MSLAVDGGVIGLGRFARVARWAYSCYHKYGGHAARTPAERGFNIEESTDMRIAQLHLGLRCFLSWWAEGLAAWLPAPVYQRLFGGPAELRVAVDGPRVQVTHQRRGVRTDLLRLDLETEPLRPGQPRATGGWPGHGRILLELPAQQVLVTTLDLPVMRARERHQVVLHQLDQVSPFRKDQVYFGCRAGEHDRQSGHQRIELSVVPKAVVTPALDAARRIGLVPEAIAVAGGAEVPLPAVEPALRRLCTGLNPVLAVLLVLLLAVAALLPLLNQHRQIERLEQVVAQQARQAQQVAQRREELQRLRDEAGTLNRRRHEALSSLRLLTELSAGLDDHTHLQRLELRDDRLHLAGVSRSAVTALATLEQLPSLAEVRFNGPVTRTSDGAESFRIDARLESPTGR